MIDYYSPNLDITLTGCGFLGGYHLGAICLLQQIWPQRPFERICGASSGGLLGALVAAGVDLHQVLDSAMDIMRQVRRALHLSRAPSADTANLAGRQPSRPPTSTDQASKAPMRRSVANLLRDKLERLMPADAHLLCNRRLAVSLTHYKTFENRLVTEFESREQLLDCIIAGCFIPLWSGALVSPKIGGERYVDGGFTNNLPKFPLDTEQLASGRRQVALCPFTSNADVTPPEPHYWFQLLMVGLEYRLNWRNLKRGLHSLFPHKLEVYKRYLRDGHAHMKSYVIANDMVKCERCYAEAAELAKIAADDAASQSNEPQPVNVLGPAAATLIAAAGHTDHKSKAELRPKPGCLSCLILLEKVDNLRIPDQLLDCFHE